MQPQLLDTSGHGAIYGPRACIRVDFTIDRVEKPRAGGGERVNFCRAVSGQIQYCINVGHGQVRFLATSTKYLDRKAQVHTWESFVPRVDK